VFAVATASPSSQEAGCSAIAVPALSSATVAQLLGAEFVSNPEALVNTVPLAFGGAWLTADGTPAPLDADGWPLADAYAVFFDYVPSPHDPVAFLPSSIWGDYELSFAGAGEVVLNPAGPGLFMVNSTFDAASWTTLAYVRLSQDGGANTVPGFALGLFQTQREPGAANGTGFRDLRVMQPGYSRSDAGGRMFTRAVTDALAPFRQVRMHEWSGTDTVPCSYPCTVSWSQRRLLTDALWTSASGGKALAVGAPWEAALALSHEAGNKSLWVNVPVYVTGEDPDDKSSYVYALASMLRYGNASVGIPGLAAEKLWVEHGNELWLNTSSTNYAWNRAAAISEVAAGGSPLNNDGSTDVEAWARRRHAKRLREISAIFARVFAGSPATVVPVFAWMQEYAADASEALVWLELTYGAGAVNSSFGAYAINSYRVPAMPHDSTSEAVLAALFLASDATVPARRASFALAASYGLPLVSYEGAGWALPLGDGSAGDNATMAAIIDAHRSQGAAEQQAYDLLVNWGPLGGAESNLYALSGPYGPSYAACFGLTEDVHNTSEAKYAGVVSMQRDEAGAAEAAVAARELHRKG
jgi:hypothetical protein